MTVPTWRHWLLLEPAARGEDAAILFLRLATGVFLIDGVRDNIASDARMREFVEFMRAAHFPAPELLAPFSVWTQFLAGVLLLPGLLVRWAGAILAVTFVVALWMVHWQQPLRLWWPALALVAIGLVLLTRGGGALSADRLLQRRQR